jgi:ABC-type nitrate/sulfonate/bicarbonate transport system permease component
VAVMELKHPTSVQSVSNQVEQELTAGAWSTPEKVAIGLGITIALGILIGLAALYVRARYMAPPGRLPVPDPPSTLATSGE